jgi:PTH1 family peptidyl-tRNA hydrolase
MYVIVGLGNPGKKYENTRHNIGFITVDLLAERHGIKINKIKHKALVGEGTISDQKVLLVKPQTYMNLSGNSVREVMAYYKVEVENLLVIYDDIDIPTGSVRIRKKGSAGTHNGMRSVIYDLQSDQFPRIRIGMGGNIKADLKDFVTGGFTKNEKAMMEKAVEHSADSVECFLRSGIDKAMNEYNIAKPLVDTE